MTQNYSEPNRSLLQSVAITIYAQIYVVGPEQNEQAVPCAPIFSIQWPKCIEKCRRNLHVGIMQIQYRRLVKLCENSPDVKF